MDIEFSSNWAFSPTIKVMIGILWMDIYFISSWHLAEMQSSQQDITKEDKTLGNIYTNILTCKTALIIPSTPNTRLIHSSISAKIMAYKYVDMWSAIINPNAKHNISTLMPEISRIMWNVYWLAMDMTNSDTACKAITSTRQLFLTQVLKAPTYEHLFDSLAAYSGLDSTSTHDWCSTQTMRSWCTQREDLPNS